MRKKTEAYSLIELLISITIIAILASMMLVVCVKTYKKQKYKLKTLITYFYNPKIEIMLYDGNGDSKDVQMRINKNQDIYLGYNENIPVFDTNNLVEKPWFMSLGDIGYFNDQKMSRYSHLTTIPREVEEYVEYFMQNYDRADSIRIFTPSEPETIEKYEEIRRRGCCGHVDYQKYPFKVNGKEYYFGFNYGH